MIADLQNFNAAKVCRSGAGWIFIVPGAMISLPIPILGSNGFAGVTMLVARHDVRLSRPKMDGKAELTRTSMPPYFLI